MKRRKLRFSNKYEKMAPEELEGVLKSFYGLDDRVLDVVWRVSQVLFQHYLGEIEREVKKNSLSQRRCLCAGMRFSCRLAAAEG